MTALHLAAIYGLKNFVKFLAKDFNAVNIKDIKGRIPLHYCAGKFHLELYQQVVKLNLFTHVVANYSTAVVC